MSWANIIASDKEETAQTAPRSPQAPLGQEVDRFCFDSFCSSIFSTISLGRAKFWRVWRIFPSKKPVANFGTDVSMSKASVVLLFRLLPNRV